MLFPPRTLKFLTIHPISENINLKISSQRTDMEKCNYFLIPNFISGKVRVLCGQAASSELQPTERVCWREGKSDTSEESPTPSTRDSCQQSI